jgi:heme/copper-type cytochrome/quinol oxidase subunit 1
LLFSNVNWLEFFSVYKFSSKIYSYSQLLKARILYIANNWIYTTNHKRIAVNYFYFVIFSGIVGMVLATIIRLEMAYPGVGILAGDSLQYLSVVTAHAVVMVFFMIMPLIFGAFANFLLPTQLGVHDVAFPRLNSAAFWFLPAGFIMLAQMVCLDRRYQRMNCYNIREVQTLLRTRYQPALWEATDHRNLYSETMLALRYQLAEIENMQATMHLYAQYGTYNGKLTRDAYFYWQLENSTDSVIYYWTQILAHHVLDFIARWTYHWNFPLGWEDLPLWPTTLGVSNGSIWPQTTNSLSDWNSNEFLTTGVASRSWLLFGKMLITDQVTNLYYVISDFFTVFSGAWNTSTTNLTPTTLVYKDLNTFQISANFDVFYLLPKFVYQSMNDVLIEIKLFSISNLLIDFTNLLNNLITLVWPTNFINVLSNVFYQSVFTNSNTSSNFELYSASKSWVASSVEQSILMSGEEISSTTRRQRNSSPVVGYNFKVGDFYPSTTLKLYPSVFRSVSDVTRGVRRASWYFSPAFYDLWKENFGNYMHRVVHTSDYPMTDARSRPTSLSNNASFYNVFYLISNSNGYINSRWISLNSLDQKFYRMFMSSTMQQRIHTNWRHLKFTREAWRCRLLASRHQKTLYKRFTKEESLVWSVEKNAKDVLPGWAMITPFSARVRYTAIGKVDLGLMGVFLVLNSSMISSANFLVTYRYLSTLNNRKMRDARSFFTEGVFVASWMMLAANPMLAIGILMLLSDRHWQTCFFDYSGGGDTVLFQHMFWFFGHPEVYVIMIPAFGFNNTILSFYLRKRVSARASLMYSMYTIAFLGFFVWGHHMYMVGLAHTTRMLFSTLTVMISVPAATKLMHWCVTLVNSSFWVELPLVCCLFFIFFFVSGGISGMAVAHTGMDVLFHDSFYVIGHFHVMFAAAAMIGNFAAFYFYFPSIFGLKYSRVWGYLHISYFTVGQLMTVIPMLWLGYSGMPRRILDYPASLAGWHAIISAGHLLSVAGLTAFFVMIFDSMRQGRPAVRNTFGVSRFNTRFSFYIYESARLLHIQHKGWYVARASRTAHLSTNLIYYPNNEVLETTLYSYVFVQPNSNKQGVFKNLNN